MTLAFKLTRATPSTRSRAARCCRSASGGCWPPPSAAAWRPTAGRAGCSSPSPIDSRRYRRQKPHPTPLRESSLPASRRPCTRPAALPLNPPCRCPHHRTRPVQRQVGQAAARRTRTPTTARQHARRLLRPRDQSPTSSRRRRFAGRTRRRPSRQSAPACRRPRHALNPTL